MSTEPRPTSANGIVITFFSTASAVGKTLVACNMASELAREGYRVCLVDFDLQFGDVCHFLKLQPTKTLADLQRTMQVEGDSCRVQDFLTPYDRADVHFSVLAAPKLLEEAYNIHHDYAVRAVRALQRQFDYILIDMASMFSTLNLAMLDQSTIVTFLGIVDFLPTIKNMKIGMDTLKTLGYDKNKIRLVLNRSDAKTRISLADVQKLLGEPFYHVLPNDFRAASTSIRDGIPLVLAPQRTALGDALRALVDRYTNHSGTPAETEAKQQESSWLSRIFG